MSFLARASLANRGLTALIALIVGAAFAATGAITLQLVTGAPLDVPDLIGMLMLVGIVVTNAIVLLDLINQYHAQGMGVREAVVEGGRRRRRERPAAKRAAGTSADPVKTRTDEHPVPTPVAVG